MKWHERIRYKMSPQTCSIIGWAGFFAALFIAIIPLAFLAVGFVTWNTRRKR